MSKDELINAPLCAVEHYEPCGQGKIRAFASGLEGAEELARMEPAEDQARLFLFEHVGQKVELIGATK